MWIANMDNFERVTNNGNEQREDAGVQQIGGRRRKNRGGRGEIYPI
jgi:hypothetical protein